MKPTLEDIFYAVLEAFDINEETYRNIQKSRKSLAVSVRQVICWIGQNTYGYTQNEIGLYLGLDHSTVWHNKMKVEDYIYPNTTILVPKKDIKYYFTKDNDTLLSVNNTLKSNINNLLKQNKNIFLREGQLIVYKDY